MFAVAGKTSFVRIFSYFDRAGNRSVRNARLFSANARSSKLKNVFSSLWLINSSSYDTCSAGRTKE